MKTATILFLLLAATASARLGETREQLVARYGPPIQYGGDAFFAHGFLVITSGWHYAKVGAIGYQKQSAADADPVPISANAIRILLDANGTGWTQTAEHAWASPDAIAFYDPSNLMLHIQSRAYLAWRKEQQTQNENTSMQGL